jgi:hypothetical protein
MADRPARKRQSLLFACLAVPAVVAGILTLGAGTAGATAPSPTTSTATVNPTTTTVGTSVTYTITVTSSAGTPQGAAQFLIGDKVLCAVASLSNGVGFCASSSAPPGTDVITADFPGNLGWAGSSGNTTLTVNVPAPPPPFGATGSSSGSNVSQTGDVVVHQDELFAQGNGPGSITVATYSADPVSPAVPRGVNVYGDVAVGNGSGFSSVYVIQCDEGAASSLMFYNGTAWQEFSSQSNSADCLFGAVTSATTPTLAQLTGTPVATSTLPAPGAAQGYWLDATDGGIFAFHRPFYGSTGSIQLNQPMIGMAATHDDGGYWLAAADGGVFTFGDALYFGSLPGENHRTSKVVSILADPATGGYVLILNDGTVWDFHTPSFGDLPFFGFHVSNIVGGAFTSDGRGLYLVGADGRVYPLLGDDTFQGDVSALHLNAPVIGMTVDPATGGYWELGKDGGVFSFNAPFFGSTGNIRLNQPVDGLTPTADGGGYWFVASDGGVFSFGDAQFWGSTGSIRLNKPVVGMAGG